MGEHLTHRENILESLEEFPGGLCDDCLARVAEISPRQTVNQLCRSLAESGQIRRERGTCDHTHTPKTKILNKLNPATISEVQLQPPSSIGETSISDTGPWLDDYRRQIIRILNRIEGSTPRGEPFGKRIARLRNDRRIPGNVASLIMTWNSYRNLVQYEEFKPSPQEIELLRAVKNLLTQWNSDTL